MRDAFKVDRQAELVFVDDLVTAEPGQVAKTSIRLRNTSGRVVHFSLRPVPSGPAASWVKISPDSIDLLEYDDAQAEVSIQPPPGARSAAGRVPFGVIADPGPDSDMLPTVAEADVAVGAVHALDARLVPRKTRGRFGSKMRVEFLNLGNEEMRISVTGSDEADNEVLHFATAKGPVLVPSGGSADAFLKVRPDKPIIVGKPVDQPFVVTYARRTARLASLESDSSAGAAATLNGLFTQKPIVSKWMMVVAALVAALTALVFVVRRASAADPVPPAPVAPTLVSAKEDDGILIVKVIVSDNPAYVEGELIEQPSNGNYDLAEPISADPAAQSEGDGPNRMIQIPLGASDEVAEVNFRYRSVDADERPSIWKGGSAVRQSSIAFEKPVVDVAWRGSGDVIVTWSTPNNPDDVTFDYRLRNAETKAAIDVETTENSAIVPMAGDPFPIQVQVVNEDDPSQRSDWSEPAPPPVDRPSPQSALPTPTNVRITWLDNESVVVSWDPPPAPPGVRLDFMLVDEHEIEIENAVFRTTTSRTVDMPEIVGVSVVAFDKDGNFPSSPASAPRLPEGERPPPTTAVATTTTTTPATTTTTQPPLPKPQDFWILPQGAVPVTDSDRVAWELFIPDHQLTLFVVGQADLRDLEGRVPFEDGDELWVDDAYESQAAARQACQQLLASLVTSGQNETPSECWVVGPGAFERVPPPATSTTTTTL